MITPPTLHGLEPPRAPTDLRRRVLSAARAAAATRRRGTLWDALFHSRAMRWSWAASTAILLLGHGALSLLPTTDTLRPRDSASAAAARQQLLDDVELPDIDAGAPRIGVGGNSTEKPDDEKGIAS